MKIINNLLFGIKYCWFLIFLFSCNQNKRKTPASSITESYPNIILILADDMGYGDPTSYNPGSNISTPNIDKIAENGIRLTDAYAHPWCVPSRFGLLTGRHPANSRLNWRERSLIDSDDITIASLLQRNDYYTAMIGKWHLGFDNFNWVDIASNCRLTGGPVDHGFDYFFGIHSSLDISPYFYIENDQCIQPPVNYIEDNRTPGATRPVSGAFWREGNIAPDFVHSEVHPVFTEKAVEFIREFNKKGNDQPFFLYLALASPHTPWLPSPEFQGKSGAGLYGDFVMQVDNTVGQIRDLLIDLRLDDNTLLIFTSDNGPLWFLDDIEKFEHRAAGELRGMKQDAWEGGHRIPFVAQWTDRIPANTVREDIVSFDDMLATFAAIIGDELPEKESLDSYNILPVLLNNPLDEPIREELFIYNRGIRYGYWKFIEGLGQGRVSRVNVNDSSLIGVEIEGELYNLEEDISESNNLYEQYPVLVNDLKRRLNVYKIN